MPHAASSNRLIRKNVDDLASWVDGFLRDAQGRNLSPRTVQFYQNELANFTGYCQAQDVTTVTGITADLVRGFITWLETEHHRNPGGRHAAFRAVRAFLRWWEVENEPGPGWTNPASKVKAPKVSHNPIPGVSPADVGAMAATCQSDFTGYRDKALLFCLLDTGARAAEFIALNIDDVDFISGAVNIHNGKGSKHRLVFVGKKSRRALRAYLKQRADNDPALWVTADGSRLAVASLRQILIRRAKRATVPIPSPHDFRRGFALAMLRSGTDLFTLQKLMGHADLTTLRLYLDLATDDARKAHEKGGPVDRL